MKTVKFTFDPEKVKAPQEVKDKLKSPADFKSAFEDILYATAEARHEKMGHAKQRCFSRVLEKLDATEDDCITIEDSDFDFLKDIFLGEGTMIHPRNIRIMNEYKRNIQEAAGSLTGL